MIKPLLQDDAFLEDVSRAKKNPDQLHFWWLGQSGFLIQWQGHHLLIDPYLSDSLTKKYAGTNKPHVRMTERVIAPERLDFVDVVTSSHNHTDHLDGETLIPLWKANPNLRVIVSRANINFAAERLQVSPERLTPIHVDGEAIKINPFAFYAIPSAHETLEQDENGDHRFIGLIIQIGRWTIYHSGDCVLYDGLVERLKKWNIDIALLPINGRDPARGVPGNFTAEEAAQLGKQITAGLVVPCHYEMFEFNTVSPQRFVVAAEKIKLEYRLLKCGERLNPT
ncbi:MAG TPA: MBL fold metallo-hydrolase [Anaerolineales bacterium]|nr:MBL fold metallo-hydrolase [Anaerolineales bacterium]